MKPAQLSNANERYLNRLVESGQFPNPNAALRQAVEYLKENLSMILMQIEKAKEL